MGKTVSSYPELKAVSNRRLALQVIREEGPISRAEIARRLQLSRPTASRIVDSLEQAGLIVSTGKSEPTGGRLGDLYSFRGDAGFVIGLELGTREARLALAKLNSEIVHRATRTLSLEKRQSVLPQLSLFMKDAIKASSGNPASILAIGVAVPGVVHSTPVSGYVDAAKVFPGLNDRPLRSELEHVFHVPVTMDNDVNFAAIGECQSGCAQGHRNVVYVFVGRGIGAGLVLDGHLFRGSSQAAGEVGNMVVDRANLHQNFGKRGCLESLAGMDRLIAASQAAGYASSEECCERAFSGEGRAQEIISETNEYLAAAMINLVAVLDPEVVVLGGDLSELPHAEALFVRSIEQLMRRQLGVVPPLRLSSLLGDAPLYGAVQAAIGIALNVAGQSDFTIEDRHERANREISSLEQPQT
jgi:predicted NBD/HSP70 family sugar kinase